MRNFCQQSHGNDIQFMILRFRKLNSFFFLSYLIDSVYIYWHLCRFYTAEMKAKTRVLNAIVQKFCFEFIFTCHSLKTIAFFFLFREKVARKEFHAIYYINESYQFRNVVKFILRNELDYIIQNVGHH